MFSLLFNEKHLPIFFAPALPPKLLRRLFFDFLMRAFSKYPLVVEFPFDPFLTTEYTFCNLNFFQYHEMLVSLANPDGWPTFA